MWINREWIFSSCSKNKIPLAKKSSKFWTTNQRSKKSWKNYRIWRRKRTQLIII